MKFLGRLDEAFLIFTGAFIFMAFYFNLNSVTVGASFPEAQQIPIFFSDKVEFSPQDLVIQSRDHFHSVYFDFMRFLVNSGWDVREWMPVILFALNISIFVLLHFIFRTLGLSLGISLFLSALSFGDWPMFFSVNWFWKNSFIYLSNNSVVLPFLLVSFWAVFTKRYWLAFSILGLSIYVHALNGVHAFLCVLSGLGFQFLSKNRGDLRSLRPHFVGVVIFGVLFLPYLFMYLGGSQNINALDFKVLSAVNWRDSFVFEWPLESFISYLASLALFFRFQKEIASKELRHFLIGVVVCGAILSLIMIVGVDGFQSKMQVLFMGSRSTRLTIIATIIALGFWLSAERNKKIQILHVLTFSMVLLLPREIFSFHFELLAVYVFLVDLLRERTRSVVSFASLFLFSILFFVNNEEPIAIFRRLDQFSGFHLLVLQICLLSAFICASFRASMIRNGFFVLLIVVSATNLKWDFRERLGVYSDWVEAQRFVKKIVLKPDEMVLTPPWLTGFRIFSERSPVLEWQDGTQQFFHFEVSKQFKDRATLLDLDADIPLAVQDDMVENFSVATLQTVKEKYKVRYYLASIRRNKNYGLGRYRILFENNSFRLLAI